MMRAIFLNVRKGDKDVKRERVNDNERILEGVSIAKALWQLHSGKAILGSLDGSIDRLLVVFFFFLWAWNLGDGVESTPLEKRRKEKKAKPSVHVATGGCHCCGQLQ